jgi:myo-inositol 2-dehydrogenase/D-chiro-inositol 1-dehydrogenase
LIDDGTIRYGIIGSGMMGCEHIRNIAALEGACVSAIADPHEDSRQRALEACGPNDRMSGVDAYADYRELLEKAEVDALVVASPNHTHARVMEAVFGTDLHVLLEKPMCTTLEDCRRVVERADAHAGIVQVGLEYRYMPPIAHFLRELPSIGDLKMLFIREHRFPFLPKVGDWNRFTRNTGGTLVEKCCHFFDLMNQVVGSNARRVYASGAQDVNHLEERYDGETPDILDNAFVIVDYENGVRACLDLCMFAESSRQEQEIVATGSAGKLEVSVPGGQLIRGGREYRKWEEIAPEPDLRVVHDGFHHGASYIEHLLFLDAIRSGGRPEVDVHDGLLSVAIGVAAHRSIEEGRPVDVAELGPLPAASLEASPNDQGVSS